jgi:hypothetical protein
MTPCAVTTGGAARSVGNFLQWPAAERQRKAILGVHFTISRQALANGGQVVATGLRGEQDRADGYG